MTTRREQFELHEDGDDDGHLEADPEHEDELGNEADVFADLVGALPAFRRSPGRACRGSSS
jgi:hypothetical protein